jgi:hypothetical protein
MPDAVDLVRELEWLMACARQVDSARVERIAAPLVAVVLDALAHRRAQRGDDARRLYEAYTTGDATIDDLRARSGLSRATVFRRLAQARDSLNPVRLPRRRVGRTE